MTVDDLFDLLMLAIIFCVVVAAVAVTGDALYVLFMFLIGVLS
jgi:hypothetical protein